uniref:Putative reverse transcriptase domain-containing protein n=1 Tax=Tanacetum cinerariifolium TaxID=118510 RepID=A0A6L2LUZ7_TANCI|nr:putative reverse transcriptase domain-containing protein [Tanacetum cinerariifolium]
MRYRRWMELFSEYGCETKYNMGKANEVVDAGSRKEGVKPRRTDDQSERTFQTLENMFRACVRNMVVVGILTIPEMSFPTKIVIIQVFDVFSLEILYSRKCRSHVLWTEIGKSSLIRPELGLETTYKVVLIKEKLKEAKDRQKSYADKKRKPLEFEVGDRVLLKVSPWRGVMRFGKKEIMDREIRKLKRKLIALVNIRWNAKRGPEFTWEHED